MNKHILCLGVDNILHYCEPHKNECLCGSKIKQKINNVTDKQLEKYGWCGFCDSREFFESSEDEKV